MSPRAPRPIPAAEARDLLAQAVAPVAGEQIPIERAAGRVLSRPVTAAGDLPEFARSAMDGYAVRAADLLAAAASRPVRLALVGAVLVGERPARPLGPGEAMAIPTGGHLPDGADAVVMVEHAEADRGAVLVRHAPDPGRHVIRPGEELRQGTVVLSGGQRLRACDVAALAAMGITRVPVHRRPRVAVLSTGAEICAPAQTPPPGKVRDINQYALGAAAIGIGCDVTYAGITGEDADALERMLQPLVEAHDLVLVSGGSSIGGHDHTVDVLARLGRLLFHGVNTRPGRPTIAARAGTTLLMGLPGVPVAALVIFEAFVRPLLRQLAGEPGARGVGDGRLARLAAPYLSELGREDYLRVRLVARDGAPWAETLGGGMAVLASLPATDGLVVVGADVARLDAGDPVEVLLWS
jgi:molybdopterin molybdotransferase